VKIDHSNIAQKAPQVLNMAISGVGGTGNCNEAWQQQTTQMRKIHTFYMLCSMNA